jgi:uncharacterized membrane protein
MKTIKEYKKSAWAALKGNWPQAILAAFSVMVLSELIYAMGWGLDRLCVSNLATEEAWVLPLIVVVGFLVMLSYVLFLVLPVAMGVINSFNSLYAHSDRRILANVKIFGFSDCGRSIAGMIMMSIVTSLYSLLLLVPGIIASLALFFVPYIIKDNPDLSIMETLRLSRKMMEGHKWQLFKLQLSFLGWIFLNVLTLGIGSLWLIPYMMTTLAAFYQDVKAEYLMKEARQESAL